MPRFWSCVTAAFSYLNGDFVVFDAVSFDNVLDLIAERILPDIESREVDGYAVELVAVLDESADSEAGLVEDYQAEGMNDVELFGDRDKLVREDHAYLVEFQAHKRLGGVVFAGIDVKNRLTENEHARVGEVFSLGDIAELREIPSIQ